MENLIPKKMDRNCTNCRRFLDFLFETAWSMRTLIFTHHTQNPIPTFCFLLLLSLGPVLKTRDPKFGYFKMGGRVVSTETLGDYEDQQGIMGAPQGFLRYCCKPKGIMGSLMGFGLGFSTYCVRSSPQSSGGSSKDRISIHLMLSQELNSKVPSPSPKPQTLKPQTLWGNRYL